MGPPLRRLGPVDPSNPRVFVDVALGSTDRGGAKVGDGGRLVFELFVGRAPGACEAFRARCAGEEPCGVAPAPLRVIVDKTALLFGAAPGDAGGLAGEPVPVELDNSEDALEHDRAGLLSTEPAPGGEGVGGGFAVTLGKAPERDGVNVVFGRLLRGFGLLRELEKLPVGNDSQPLERVVVEGGGELDEGDDGIVPQPDGDPFPRWPQDYPDMSDQGDQYLGRVQAAETIKAFGNEAYKRGDFATADRKYSKALRYLEKRYTREAEVYRQEMEHMSASHAVMGPILLNSAAVKLKLGDFRGAIDACNMCHAVENANVNRSYQAEKWNAKMLFRRGQAYAGCNEFEEAMEDLARAAMVDPNDAGIRRELEKTMARMEARKKRERQTYAKMFG